MIDPTFVENILQLDQEISESKTKYLRTKEALQSLIEESDAFQKVESLKTEILAARQLLKNDLLSDSQYTKLTTELEELKFKLKDLREILSSHIVEYVTETREKQFAMPTGDARDIILKAKFASTSPYQERMFK